jgi:hypothetical protein
MMAEHSQSLLFTLVQEHAPQATNRLAVPRERRACGARDRRAIERPFLPHPTIPTSWIVMLEYSIETRTWVRKDSRKSARRMRVDGFSFLRFLPFVVFTFQHSAFPTVILLLLCESLFYRNYHRRSLGRRLVFAYPTNQNENHVDPRLRRNCRLFSQCLLLRLQSRSTSERPLPFRVRMGIRLQ